MIQRQTTRYLATFPALLFAGALAAESELPSTLAMTAYGTGSTGYTQMAAIGNVLQNRGVSVRVIPGDNDVTRMTPLRNGRVDYCACGIAAYYGSEGVLMFAGPDWGPQEIRVLITGMGPDGQGVAIADDVGVESPEDLRGKRVAYVRGADALNLNMEAFLAFGGLTWDDVERVEFPGYGAAFDGIIANRADAVHTAPNSPHARRMESSSRGVTWAPMDPDDDEAWERMHAVAPYFQPELVESGAGISEDSPWQGSNYPYPILVADAELDNDKVKPLIRFFVEDHDSYKDGAPGNTGYALDYQIMEWVVPFHDAVVEYYEETGVWTDEMQAHQDHLIHRQQVLQDAWADYTGNNPPSDESDFIEGWMEARATALEAEDMNPVFR